MISQDLLKKVRRIEITTRKMVSDVMSGQYRTRFKGQGMQFSEHRVYTPGDDVRHIDWKVSARSREPLIKKYEEERELTVLLVVDISGSESFGSAKRLKSEVIAELGGMLACAATQTGDKVGVLMFSNGVEKIIRPHKGKQHVLRVIRDLLAYTPEHGKGTDIASALESAARVMKHSGVVFVLSDFISPTGDYEIAMNRLAKRHDVVALWVGDERETNVPEVGHLLVVDPETGEEALVDTGSYAFKKWMAEYRKAIESDTQDALKGSKAELLRLSTKEDYAEALVRFFNARARRRR